MSSNMNTDQLIEWLKEKGVEQSVLDRLKEEKFTGKSFCRAQEAHFERLGSPRLPMGTVIDLIGLRDELKASGSSEVVTTGLPPSVAEPQPPSVDITPSIPSRPTGTDRPSEPNSGATGLSYQVVNKKPTMPELSLLEWTKDGTPQELRLIQEVAKNWKNLGLAGLEMKGAVLSNLEDKFDDENSCRKVFQRFLDNGSPKYERPSWGNLIQALRRAEMRDVASTLQEALVGYFQDSEDSFSLQTSFSQFGKPDMAQLMNLVGVTVRNKWREIGIGLKVKNADLDSFQMEEAGKPGANQHCMRSVFQKWYSAATSEYSWNNLVGVLESPAVDEKAAAQELYEYLTKQKK